MPPIPMIISSYRSASPGETQELLSMTTTLHEMHGLSAACRSECMSFDRRMESALNRLQEVRSGRAMEMDARNLEVSMIPWVSVFWGSYVHVFSG